jgi:succinate dehydrogenase flavin-adding protein (antitoxin of CptAB toxin-antitoxin module)
MSNDEIETLERLIDAPDPDIAASFYEGQTFGDAALDAMIERLRRFHGYEITKA